MGWIVTSPSKGPCLSEIVGPAPMNAVVAEPWPELWEPGALTWGSNTGLSQWPAVWPWISLPHSGFQVHQPQNKLFEFDILTYTLERRTGLILWGDIPKCTRVFKKQDTYLQSSDHLTNSSAVFSTMGMELVSCFRVCCDDCHMAML